MRFPVDDSYARPVGKLAGEEKLSVGGGKRLCVPSEKYVEKPGVITIKKETDPSEADVGFTFTMDGTSFTLGGGDGATFPGLSPGNYTVTEMVPSGWNLANISCTGSASTNGNSATIDLNSGEHVTCTFKNERVPLDHFKCYDAGMTLPYEVDIDLRDQFGEFKARVKEKERFCNPVSKNGEGILNEDNHLAFYRLVSGYEEFPARVDVNNQFGEQTLNLTRLQSLAVPTRKLVPGDHPEPEGLDHFTCYRVEGEAPNELVDLADQFHEELKVRVGEPTLLCNPTSKLHGNTAARPQHPEAHLVCYRLGETFPVTMENQFEKDQLLIGGGKRLCVPSEKKIYVPSEKEE